MFSQTVGENMQGWFRIKSAATYCDVSVKTIRRWLKSGLKHSVVGGTYLIKRNWLDEYLESHARSEGERVDDIVNKLIKELNNGKKN